MSPRPRSKLTRGLPLNLYLTRGTYYYWRHPITGKDYGLGTDRSRAITEAIEANHSIDSKGKATLLDRISGAAENTLNAWLDEYEKENPSQRHKLLREGLGEVILTKLEPKQIADWLKQWDLKLRMRQAMLGAVKTALNAAIGAGWIKTNPAASLTTQTPVTSRERLSLDQYKAIIAKADPVLAKAMTLALLTAQRRADIVKLQFSQVKDGFLWVEPSKTMHNPNPPKIRIPLSIGIPSIGNLGTAIGACRSNVVSRYMLHHLKKQGQAKVGGKIRDKTIESLFREARESAGITGEHPPTFHEIRSLAARIYKAQGVDVRVLLGHKTDKMAALYQDNRGSEWMTVAV